MRSQGGWRLLEVAGDVEGILFAGFFYLKTITGIIGAVKFWNLPTSRKKRRAIKGIKPVRFFDEILYYCASLLLDSEKANSFNEVLEV